MRIRMIRRATGTFGGVNLDWLHVGMTYDVNVPLGNYLLSAHFAEPSRDPGEDCPIPRRQVIRPPVSYDSHFPNDPFNVFSRCPFQDCGGMVRLSRIILKGDRQIHCHCSCCRRTWLDSEARPEGLPYRPAMAK